MYQRQLNVASMTIKRYYNDFDMRCYSTLRSGQSGGMIDWGGGGGDGGMCTFNNVYRFVFARRKKWTYSYVTAKPILCCHL